MIRRWRAGALLFTWLTVARSARSESEEKPPVQPAPAATARASASAPTEPASPALEAEMEAKYKALSQVLNPRNFGAAFELGAQAEYIGPAAGASSLLFGYDAVWAQFELSTGFALGGDLPHIPDDSRSYSVGFRVGLPVHRGVRADFSLFGGGGMFIVNPTEGEKFTLWQTAVGARIRVFMTPTVATAAALGGVLLVDPDEVNVLMGARPLGAAGVVYFFR